MPGDQKNSSGDDRHHRISALRDLIGSSQSKGLTDSPSLAQAAIHQEAMFRPYLRWLALALVISVIISGAALWLHTRAASPSANIATTAPLGITPRNDGMVCPQGVAWSPNGKSLAIVGYDASSGQSTCPTQFGPSQSQPGLINVYDTNHGRLLQQLHPDTAIRARLNDPQEVRAWLQAHPGPATSSPYIIFYTDVIWSHDSSQVYILFRLALPTSVPPGQGLPTVWPSAFFAGVEILNLSSGVAQLLVQPLTTSWQAVMWDITGGVASSTMTNAIPGSRFSSITPALGYAWSAAGHLAPQSPLPPVESAAQPPATTSRPIGSPVGGTIFSVWQSGVLSQYVIGDDDPHAVTAQALNFSTDINALSPDGHHLLEGAHIQAVVDSDSAPVAQLGLSAKGLGAMPVIHVRDRALEWAASLLPNNAYNVPTYSSALARQLLPWPGIDVAWRPDGATLAVASGASNGSVVLLDTKTGRLITHLAQVTTVPSQGSDTDGPHILRWSSDGSHLLLLDPSVATLTIWGPAQLRQA